MRIEEQQIEVDGLLTRYLTAGEGPPLLLHALGESTLDWRWVLPDPASTHRVYAPDLPGGPGCGCRFSSPAPSVSPRVVRGAVSAGATAGLLGSGGGSATRPGRPRRTARGVVGSTSHPGDSNARRLGRVRPYIPRLSSTRSGRQPSKGLARAHPGLRSPALRRTARPLRCRPQALPRVKSAQRSAIGNELVGKTLAFARTTPRGEPTGHRQSA